MRLTSRAIAVLSLGLTLAVPAIAQTSKPPAVSGAREVSDRNSRSDPNAVTRVEPAPAVVPTNTDAAPQPLGFESDIYCFGYLGDRDERFPLRVSGAENVAEQEDYITNDLLYVDGGYDKGVKVGDEYWIITPEQDVIHPVTGRSMGRLFQYRGRAVIQSIEPRTATIRVTSACTDIPMHSFLKRFEPIPIPLARKSPPAQPGDPASGKAKGRIVFTRDGVVALGADHTMIVDLGAADGLQAGDFLTVYRYSAGREYGIRPVGAYWVNLPPPPGVFIPRTYLGEGAVLVVGDRWSVIRLTDSNRLIEVGDEVELK
ncbi:MAG: hypothetical protein ABI592_10340 [Acidobacteriota bacterium]